MGVVTLFCSPGDKYKNKSKEYAVQEYKRLNEDFDAMMKFDRRLRPNIDIPDLETPLMKKGNQDLVVRLYAKHPVQQIGDVTDSFFVSSYLFNIRSEIIPKLHPEKKEPEYEYGPDLDIVSITGFEFLEQGIETLVSFYEKTYGWKTYLCNEIIPETTKVKINGIYTKITPPFELLRQAKDKYGYDMNIPYS